jgi:regulatory protein
MAREQSEQTESDRAYAQAIRFLEVRPRSRYEIVSYLTRKGWTEAVSVEVVGRVERIGLINDREFAINWIANRQLLRPRSRRRLEQELIAKGVARDDIRVALEGLEQDDELKTLIEVATKKQRLPQYQTPEKLVGYLSRQGYSYELIKKALEQLSQRFDG